MKALFREALVHCVLFAVTHFTNKVITVKPVLETTCIKQSNALGDH